MKKIKAQVNPKDRVVCVTVKGAHEFYYQPYKSNERKHLFTADDFSGSVFAHFRDYGRCIGGERGFSLTIKELYEDRKIYRNEKLTNIFDRLPGMIDHVLRENAGYKEKVKGKHKNNVKRLDKLVYEDYGLAA